MIDFCDQRICCAPIQDVYQWIHDVEAYKTWMPYCSDSGVIERLNHECVHAFISMNIGIFRETLVTSNVCIAPKQITMTLVSGPFRSFEGRWILEELDLHNTQITLQIRAQLKNRLLEPLAHILASQYKGKIIALLDQRFAKTH
jgi:ribosome-associated toxin RatA of RatAB toxin-antitoxin module